MIQLIVDFTGVLVGLLLCRINRRVESKLADMSIALYLLRPDNTVLFIFLLFALYIHTRSLGALRAPTSRWRLFGPLDFVLRALRALRPCDPRKVDQHLLSTSTSTYAA